MAKGINFASKYMWDMLLYSAMGCFSLILLTNYTDLRMPHKDNLITVQSFAAAIVLFNGVGFSMRFINEKLKTFYRSIMKNQNMMIVYWLTAGIFLFCSNCLLMIFTKIIIGAEAPFRIQTNGFMVIGGVWLVELVVAGQFMINRFYSEVIRLMKRSKELEESNAQARYMALQSQLNPHFLFNSLNTLIAEIEYNPANAVAFTRNLSDTYRYILYSQDKQTVPISEELDFLETYIKLHQVRLGECIEVDCRIPENLTDMPIPPLTLQLLAENAVKHNVISMAHPMTITIWTEKWGYTYRICFSNPICLKQGTGKSGHGLKNLSQRCEMLCGEKIEILNDNNKFTVKIPIPYE